MVKKANHLLGKVPPDGGYGWVIVMANSLCNFLTVSLLHCFGLIFKDTFVELGLSAAQGSLIVNLNAACGMMTGLINGALLKKYGCRKVALLGALFFTGGVIFTAHSKSFIQFVLSYGIITSLGNGLCQSALILCINSYFLQKRSYAMGWSTTIIGLGPIFVPQFIGFLLQYYTPEGATLIFGGICSHVFVAAILLQPVKWHMKDDKTPTDQREASVEKPKKEKKCGENVFKRMLKKIANTFDLDLCKDPIFMNIILGMALQIFADINFTVLTPFMLRDYGLETSQITTFLSTLGVTDIIFRFIAPYIGNYIAKPPRLMYACSLFLLAVTRFLFLSSSNFYVLLVIAMCLGIAKGIRKVYMALVIPAHLSLEKLASGGGMEMMIHGTFIIIGGPLLGVVRDLTGSYTLCVILMNCFTLTIITMWSIEAIILRCRKRKIDNNVQECVEMTLLNK